VSLRNWPRGKDYYSRVLPNPARNGFLSKQVQSGPSNRQTKQHGKAFAIVALIFFLAVVFLLPIFNIANLDTEVQQQYNCLGCVQVRGSLTYLLFQCGAIHENGVVLDQHYTGDTLGGGRMWLDRYTLSCLGST